MAAPQTHEVIMIGSGPSALTAAVYTTREDIPTTLYEKAAVGGMAATTDRIDNYPGFPDGIAGLELASQLQAQAKRFGAQLAFGEVTKIHAADGGVELTIDGKQHLAKAVLIATGSQYRKLGVPGEDEFFGRGVHYCATCDGAFYRDKRLAVVGGGNSAVQEALFLTRFASHIDLLVRSTLKASEVLQKELHRQVAAGTITVHQGVAVDHIIAQDGAVQGVATKQDGADHNFMVDGVFVFIGLKPNTGFLEGSGVQLDTHGSIITDERMHTNVPGVFASGDVRSGATMQIAAAVGDGAVAALSIREYLRRA